VTSRIVGLVILVTKMILFVISGGSFDELIYYYCWI